MNSALYIAAAGGFIYASTGHGTMACSGRIHQRPDDGRIKEGWEINVSTPISGVQHVHWMMHKCIMVKVGGNEIHIKYVKSRGIFVKQGGKFLKVGRNSNFR